MTGKIYSINSGKYYIKENNNMHILPAAGIFRHKKITPLVGDNVEFENEQYITKILPRKNEFIRPKVANIDHIIVVMSIKEPEFSSYLVDKYLSFIENSNVEPIIFFTKNDLAKSEWPEIYQKLGYKIAKINYKSNEWINIVKKYFKNKTCTLMGQSGVGKTTIINKITSQNFETQEISKNANRGKHTTRIVQIVDVLDGWLIDTPGFSSFEHKMSKIEIAHSFKQFRELSKLCKFKSCLHLNEPENLCNIKINVKNKNIPEFRYQNYLKILKEVKDEY
ncbi:ribosome small subunit-dependent GTPase A [Mycoplasmopsis lipofaciens]|uniref:ribosome small subunit-dependent GTPase A n=1 Tax=Mycoplasmopsis lipofaciens TaxID=114884 RepID=UPI00048906A6|nr:ribosome small subunit-dependent GTPase A [Mycoplasmopsis lipofaciens]